jgi:hypothetical protein
MDRSGIGSTASAQSPSWRVRRGLATPEYARRREGLQMMARRLREEITRWKLTPIRFIFSRRLKSQLYTLDIGLDAAREIVGEGRAQDIEVTTGQDSSDRPAYYFSLNKTATVSAPRSCARAWLEIFATRQSTVGMAAIHLSVCLGAKIGENA